MSKIPFMPLWIGDFLAKTSELSTKEFGAYMLLLMAMWTHDGSLPADPKKLARVARVGRDWPTVWAAIAHYFSEADGRITNDRLSEELQKVSAKREANAYSGARGGRANSLKYNNGGVANATGAPKQSEPEPETEQDIGSCSVARAKTRERGTRLDPDWRLPKEWGEWAVAEGMSPAATRVTADQFRDYWTAKAGPGALKRDWFATWRRWVRHELETNPRRRVDDAGDAKLEAWGIRDAKPFRPECDPWHLDPDPAAGAADLPEVQHQPEGPKQDDQGALGHDDD